MVANFLTNLAAVYFFSDLICQEASSVWYVRNLLQNGFYIIRDRLIENKAPQEVRWAGPTDNELVEETSVCSGRS